MRTLAFTLLALAAASASAQLASDQVPHERTLPMSEQVRQQLEASRWHFGAFRVQPAFAVRDFGFDNNVYGTADNRVSDWRSTVAAGVRTILPMGPKLYLRSDLVPEYTYYQKLTNRRAFGGEYGASVLGLFNRMTVRGGADLYKGIAPVSSELERAALGTRSDVNGELEIDVLRRLAVFGVAEGQRQRYNLTADERGLGSPLVPLERNETMTRGGVRYRFASYFDVSVAAERTRTNFVVDDVRDNRTKAVIFGIHYDRPRSFLNLSVGNRTGEPVDAISRFPRFSTTTGSYYASHELAVRTIVDVYGHRGIGYSLTLENPYYLETRTGLGITIPLGYRILLRAYGETGTNAYPNAVGPIKRSDDVKTVGGGFAVKMFRDVSLIAAAYRTQYNSNIAGKDRSTFRITTSISARGAFIR